MTREEAIRRMECCRDFLANNYSDMGEPNFTAFNMAIQALSQELICDRDCEHCTWTECPIEPCDDAISREAAIKVTCNDCKYDCRYRETKEYCDCCGYIDRLRTLPSVTQKSGKWVDQYNDENWHCSKCGAIVEKDEQMNHNWYFCYHCGAKMFEPQESEDKE